MALFTTSQSGDINDGGTFGNTSPGVAGTDYPTPGGGDEIQLGAHTLTVPSGQDFTVKGEVAASGAIGASGASLVINGILRQDGDMYLNPGTSYNLGTGGSHYLGGNNFGAYNNAAAVTDTYTFDGTSASPAQIFLEGGTWDSFTAHAAGKQVRVSVDIDYLVVDYGVAANTGRFKPNHEVRSASSWTFVNNGVLELRKVYDVQINEFFWGDSDVTMGTIVISSYSTAASPPRGSLIRQQTAWSAATRTMTALVVDARNLRDLSQTPPDFYFYFNGTVGVFVDLDSGGFLSPTNASFPTTFAKSFLYHPRNFSVSDMKKFDTTSRKIALAPNDNPHPFDAIEDDTITMEHWLWEATATSADGGDWFNIGTDWNSGSLTVQDILLISHHEGTLVNTLGAGVVTAVTANVHHCTAVSRENVGGSYGQLAKGENGGQWSALDVRSCLCADLSVNSSSVGIALGVADNQATVDYNGWWQVEDHYLNVSFSPSKTEGTDADFGGSDVTLSSNPFVDSSRTIATWITTQAGLADTDAWLDEIAQYNLAAWNSDYDPWTADTGMFDWVRAGYVVTDSALNGTAHDGGVIGAMGFQAAAAASNTPKMRLLKSPVDSLLSSPVQ